MIRQQTDGEGEGEERVRGKRVKEGAAGWEKWVNEGNEGGKGERVSE